MSSLDDEKPISHKRKRKVNKDEELLQEQERLEKIVFGKQHGLFDAVGITSTDHTESTKAVDEYIEISTGSSKKAAWVDEDDSRIEIPSKQKKYATTNTEDNYQNLLRRRYQQTIGNPRWASKKETKPLDSDEEEIDETMRCGNVITKKSSSLPKGTIVIQEEKDLNVETRIEGREINALEFHPTSTFTAALVAGNSGRASIIQVDGNNNSKLLTVQFQKFHIDCAHFSHDGDQFFVGSRSSRNFFYYDLNEGKSVQVFNHHAIGPLNMSNFHVSPDGKHIVVCGKDGDIHLLNARNKEWIKSSMKMNTEVVDVTFNNDGSTMYSYGENGEIFEWDMNTRCCVHQMREQGSLQGIKIALSNNNQILATGSSFGIVNLYEMPTRTKIINPKKVVDNLRTSITSLRFNNTSEILAIASGDTKNAVKLIHFPSMTVFSNFPKFQSNIGSPRIMSFSPGSGYFAVGNSEGRALLYRLKHYKNS